MKTIPKKVAMKASSLISPFRTTTVGKCFLSALYVIACEAGLDQLRVTSEHTLPQPAGQSNRQEPFARDHVRTCAEGTHSPENRPVLSLKVLTGEAFRSSACAIGNLRLCRKNEQNKTERRNWVKRKSNGSCRPDLIPSSSTLLQLF